VQQGGLAPGQHRQQQGEAELLALIPASGGQENTTPWAELVSAEGKRPIQTWGAPVGRAGGSCG
jgi:hypothetical protein